ncbi:nuclear architecture related protein [Talaromyces proteolyticus]|uniref:Cytosolic Fe-S cluster assembly factor NAR1 n=1 Tax=Talaromyces proteolyticus TaxID=1131652 RepID=A0AAD4KRB8_9EURO|nr:nuclear architecture related protein [Talaromyces proteolyticus]KAH8697549.1 nuclear architecture related protein [Talaromyces proteolyticus]
MSAILSADDLNDFISPGVACIKPVETLPQKHAADQEESYEVTTEDKVQPEQQAPAQISLTDCLACSGCVTSAEAVLISLQSHAEVLNTLDAYPPAPIITGEGGHISLPRKLVNDERIFIASVSPQVRASLSATYGISESKAGHMIDQFLRGPQGLRAGGKHQNGFTWVVDTDILRQVVLTLTAEEVAEDLQSANSSSNQSQFALPNRPILSSACPGWICYAEKTHPYVLPHLSRLKSPQALAGTFLKSILSRVLGVSPSQIWHLAIMPCFDKKLEASREELTSTAWDVDNADTSQPPVRDVDCVITSRELLMLASSRNTNLSSLPLKPLALPYAPHFPDHKVDSFLFSKTYKQDQHYGSSGGYLYYVLSSFQARHAGSNIVTQRGRNSDVLEYTLVSESGQTILKAARYYGFRNIQNLVRRLKPARASRLPGVNKRGTAGTASTTSTGLDYAYVEVMACPGGCTNGGGQIRIDDAREANASLRAADSDDPITQTQKSSVYEQRAWLARVDEAYFSADSDDEPEHTSSNASILERESRSHDIVKYWTELTGSNLESLVYTTYRKVESDVGKDKKSVNDTARVVELAGKIGGGW